MSLKHLLALAGLGAMAACSGLTENQSVCWFNSHEETYRCEEPNPQEFPVPAPEAAPDADEDA